MPDRYDDDSSIDDLYRKEAGIYAEFGKIVCISVGIIYLKDGEKHCRIKSFFGHDEKTGPSL